MSEKINQWSYSRLATFESCPKKAHFAYVRRIKEPGNKAMDRGKNIHTMCEDYIRGRYETIPKELADFEEAFDVLKDLHLKGYVTCEARDAPAARFARASEDAGERVGENARCFLERGDARKANREIHVGNRGDLL